MNVFDTIKQTFGGEDGKTRLYGLGLIASQMAAGQTPNAGPAMQMLERRRQQRELSNTMQGGDFMGQFSPQERAFLATLPPEAAQQLIAQRIFAAPVAPVSGTEINGQLVNPVTGAVMGDYRDEEEDDSVVRYIASGESATALGLPAEGAYNVVSGPEGMTATAIGGGGQTIQIGSEVGTIPQGYELHTDPATGARSLKPIAGGPADNSAQLEMAEESQQNTANLMTEDLSRARELIENSPTLTTGVIGNALKGWAGSKSADLSALLDTIGANISFEYLNAMRQASPTGGALGQVSERELALLTATAGSLSQAQSPEQLLHNLERLQVQFDEIIHGTPEMNTSGATRLRYDPATGEFK